MIDITAQAINWRGYPVTLLSDGVCRLLGTDDPLAFAEGRSPAYHLRLALATATDTAESDEPSGWYFASRLLAQSVCIERFGGLRTPEGHEGGQWSVYLPGER